MKTKLEKISQETFEWLEEAINKAPVYQVKLGGLKSPQFYNEEKTFELPTSAGVCIVYSINNGETPIYAGETNNLRRRLIFQRSKHCDGVYTRSRFGLPQRQWLKA